MKQLIISLYYQNFHLNATCLNPDNLIVNAHSASRIREFSKELLGSFGYPIKDEFNFIDVCEAIHRLMNIEPHRVGLEEAFKEIGHTSMSIGDYIVFTVIETVSSQSGKAVAYVCAPVGWELIDDYYMFYLQQEDAANAIKKLPINVVLAMAAIMQQDPIAYRAMFNHFKDTKCENQCPKCSSEDIEWSTKEIQDSLVYQNATCNKCGCEFTEEYCYTRTVVDEKVDAESIK